MMLEMDMCALALSWCICMAGFLTQAISRLGFVGALLTAAVPLLLYKFNKASTSTIKQVQVQ
jgi:hypothetical protein